MGGGGGEGGNGGGGGGERRGGGALKNSGISQALIWRAAKGVGSHQLNRPGLWDPFSLESGRKSPYRHIYVNFIPSVMFLCSILPEAADISNHRVFIHHQSSEILYGIMLSL